MATKTKIKTQAATYSCQTKDQTAEAIKQLGDVQREITREQTLLNDKIAALTSEVQPKLDALRQRAETLSVGIQTWCEANREAICGNGKTANLITGEVNWRQRPPSVRISAAEKVLETLQKLGLERFIRPKNEVNKDAILADKSAVAGIKGITVVEGIEDFVITPFEVEVE